MSTRGIFARDLSDTILVAFFRKQYLMLRHIDTILDTQNKFADVVEPVISEILFLKRGVS